MNHYERMKEIKNFTDSMLMLGANTQLFKARSNIYYLIGKLDKWASTVQAIHDYMYGVCAESVQSADKIHFGNILEIIESRLTEIEK